MGSVSIRFSPGVLFLDVTPPGGCNRKLGGQIICLFLGEGSAIPGQVSFSPPGPRPRVDLPSGKVRFHLGEVHSQESRRNTSFKKSYI